MHDVIVFTHSGGSLIRVTQLLMLFGMLSITIAIRGLQTIEHGTHMS